MYKEQGAPYEEKLTRGSVKLSPDPLLWPGIKIWFLPLLLITGLTFRPTSRIMRSSYHQVKVTETGRAQSEEVT